MSGVTMSKDAERGPAESASIDEAGMTETIGQDEVAGSHQGGNQSDIGQVAGAEDQRVVGALEAGQCRLQVLMRGNVPEIRREAPEPTPNRSMAATAACLSAGWVARPR